MLYGMATNNIDHQPNATHERRKCKRRETSRRRDRQWSGVVWAWRGREGRGKLKERATLLTAALDTPPVLLRSSIVRGLGLVPWHTVHQQIQFDYLVACVAVYSLLVVQYTAFHIASTDSINSFFLSDRLISRQQSGHCLRLDSSLTDCRRRARIVKIHRLLDLV